MSDKVLPGFKDAPSPNTPKFHALLRHMINDHLREDDNKDPSEKSEILESYINESPDQGLVKSTDSGENLKHFHDEEHRYQDVGSDQGLTHTHSD